jgi:hypothetical protein
VAELARVADVLAAQIGDGPFLIGTQFTVADGFLSMLTGWSGDLGAGSRWSDNATLEAHYNQLPSGPRPEPPSSQKGSPQPTFPSPATDNPLEVTKQAPPETIALRAIGCLRSPFAGAGRPTVSTPARTSNPV